MAQRATSARTPRTTTSSGDMVESSEMGGREGAPRWPDRHEYGPPGVGVKRAGPCIVRASAAGPFSHFMDWGSDDTEGDLRRPAGSRRHLLLDDGGAAADPHVQGPVLGTDRVPDHEERNRIPDQHGLL